jgi:hypothetical protein
VANKVFANGREVSCKAANGKAVAAFPDVCFTPPTAPPTPPGVPIPYPNTGMASDATDGSKTVKISGKEVMLKNKSCFSKSTGDEAGSAPKKGVVTSQNRGKVYFTAWSMDVKFEGENVVRHLDMTTHNHASMPGNTPPWPYMDSMAFGGEGPCKDTAKKVEEKCGKHVKTSKSGEVKRKASVDAMCADKECNEARKCVLSPYSPSNCCDGKTPHHVIPAHCFMPPGVRAEGGTARYPGCEKYDDAKAPCVCVTGKDKATGDHKRAHDHFDRIEDMQPGHSWTYEAAAKTGAASVKAATGGDAGGCDESCTKAQLDDYHGKQAGIAKNTPIRADSTGQRTPRDFVPKVEKGVDR